MSRPSLLQEIGDVALFMLGQKLINKGASAISDAFNDPSLDRRSLLYKAKAHLANIESAIRYGFDEPAGYGPVPSYVRALTHNDWEAQQIQRAYNRDRMDRGEEPLPPPYVAPDKKYMFMTMPKNESVKAPGFGFMMEKVIYPQREWRKDPRHYVEPPALNLLDFVEEAARKERSFRDAHKFRAELRENLAQKAAASATLPPRQQRKFARQQRDVTNRADAMMLAAKKYPPDQSGAWSPHQFAKYTGYRDRLLGR